MNFILRFLLTATFLLLSPFSAQSQQQETQPANTPNAHSLERLTWLAETWHSEKDGKTTEEVWMAPRGGMMLGMNRSTKGNRATFENLRIVESDGNITYLASPAGAKPTPFQLIELSENKAVFENKEHDFPQRIIYQRTSDQLVARIEGKMGGKERSMEWTWNKKTHPEEKHNGRFRGLRTATYRVEDLPKAKAWYSEVLGIAPYFDEPYYVGFKIGNQELGLDPDVDGLVRGNNQPVYWGVKNCKESYGVLLKAGAKPDSAPQDVGEGTIVATVSDPFGNIFGIIEIPGEGN